MLPARPRGGHRAGPGRPRGRDLEKLEERIAPKKGWNNPKNPHYVDPYTGSAICPY
jgi:hypothetical protein